MRVLIVTFLALFTSAYFAVAQKNYSEKKTTWILSKNELQKEYSSVNTEDQRDSILTISGTILSNLLVDSIFPYWYGTPWDFNGYTNVPNQGTIACGYFVSTTLKHIGFNLNRYKMAQQASLTEVKIIQGNNSYKQKHYSSNNELNQWIKDSVQDGLYVVGLDSHVGFVYKTASQIDFIHSNYLNEVCVTRERLLESDAIGNSRNIYFADITHNKEFIKKWIFNTEIKIITP